MTIDLVLLPGLICDERLWRDTIAGLGQGETIWIGDLTLDRSIAGMASRVLATMPDRFALAGLSMGGYVALEIMRQAPERVTHLALLDTSARPDDEARKAGRRKALEAVERGEFELVSRNMLAGLLAPDHLASPLAEDVEAMQLRVGEHAFRRQQTAIMERVDSRRSLRDIAVPTLVGVGELDTLTPRELAEELAAGIAGAELVTFAGSGHLSAIEAPAAVADAMRAWLAR
jgi:pimeloyl-ACP methyl ester carboxylesterase